MLGSVFRVDAATPALSERIHSLLRPFSCPPKQVPLRHALSLENLDGLTELLVEVNRRALGGFDGLAVHAGVVGWEGHAIAFPAPSGGGKTTLTAAAVAAGFTYVSDEALCVDLRALDVIPYPRPMALSPWSRAALRLEVSDGEYVRPDSLGGPVASEPVRLHHVLSLQRGPSEPDLRPVHRSEAVIWLLGQAFNHFLRPNESFQAVTRLADDAQAWVLVYDDPVAAATLLHNRLTRG